MHLAVAPTIIGQTILLARPALALYAAAVVAAVATFVPHVRGARAGAPIRG